jgi:hypothetical protein
MSAHRIDNQLSEEGVAGTINSQNRQSRGKLALGDWDLRAIALHRELCGSWEQAVAKVRSPRAVFSARASHVAYALGTDSSRREAMSGHEVRCGRGDQKREREREGGRG